MNSTLIDTNFYIGIVQGDSHAKNVMRNAKEVLICPIVIGELLYGFKNGRREEMNIEQLDKFFGLPSVQSVPLTEKTAEFFALVIHELKKAGTPVPTNDIWIAACAMEHGCAVATFDNHFKKISGLLLA